MSHDPFGTSPALPPPLPPPVAPAPWGLLGSIAWGAAGVAIWFIAQLVVVAVYIRIHASGDNIDFKQFESNGFLLALVTTIACPFWVGTMALASRLRGWRVRDYLALVMPRRSEVLFGIACLAALLIAFDLLTLAFGSDVVPPFMRDAYISARSSNSLVLFFIAVVVVGAHHRGDRVSRLPVSRPERDLARGSRDDSPDLGRVGSDARSVRLGAARTDFPDRAVARLASLGERLDTTHHPAARAGQPRGHPSGGDQGGVDGLTRMIPKSRYRFSDKIMRKITILVHHARIDRRRAFHAEHVLQRLRGSQIRASLRGGPAICRPTGSFSLVNPHGNDSAAPHGTVIA
jgi:hypothetical protein